MDQTQVASYHNMLKRYKHPIDIVGRIGIPIEEHIDLGSLYVDQSIFQQFYKKRREGDTSIIVCFVILRLKLN